MLFLFVLFFLHDQNIDNEDKICPHGNQFYKKSIYVCLLRDLGRRKSNREGKTDVLSIRLAQGQMFPYIGVVLNDKFPFYRTKN